jgi:hypothetical protein
LSSDYQWTKNFRTICVNSITARKWIWSHLLGIHRVHIIFYHIMLYTSPLSGWNCSDVHLALIGMKLFWCTPRPYWDEIVLMYTSPLSGWNCSVVHLALIGMKLFWCTPRSYRDEIVLMYTSPLSGEIKYHSIFIQKYKRKKPQYYKLWKIPHAQNNFIPIRARCTSEQFHPDKGEGLVYAMLPVSLDCPFCIAPSVFSNLYLLI